MPPTVSTIICVCWWVVLGVITAPSFVQVTVVAGPPVEVQVRVLDSLSNVTSVTLGEPACRWTQELRNCTLYYHHNMFWEVYHFSHTKSEFLKGHFSVRAILYITSFSCNKNICVHNIAIYNIESWSGSYTDIMVSKEKQSKERTHMKY